MTLVFVFVWGWFVTRIRFKLLSVLSYVSCFVFTTRQTQCFAVESLEKIVYNERRTQDTSKEKSNFESFFFYFFVLFRFVRPSTDQPHIRLNNLVSFLFIYLRRLWLEMRLLIFNCFRFAFKNVSNVYMPFGQMPMYSLGIEFSKFTYKSFCIQFNYHNPVHKITFIGNGACGRASSSVDQSERICAATINPSIRAMHGLSLSMSWLHTFMQTSNNNQLYAIHDIIWLPFSDADIRERVVWCDLIKKILCYWICGTAPSNATNVRNVSMNHL